MGEMEKGVIMEIGEGKICAWKMQAPFLGCVADVMIWVNES